MRKRRRKNRSANAPILGYCPVCHAHVELPCQVCRLRRIDIRPSFAEAPADDLMPDLDPEAMEELGRQRQKSLALKASQFSVYKRAADVGAVASRMVTVFAAQRGKGFS